MATTKTRVQIEVRHLECRDVGHLWSQISYGRPTDRNTVVPRVLVCGRCESERHEEINTKTGEKLSYSYKYADGYLLPRGSGKYVRAWARQEVVARAIKKMLARSGRKVA